MLATVGASLESDEPSVVHGAVDQRGGHVLVAEHAPPAGELDVHDMGHAPGLVGIRYDLEQEPGALLVDRHVAELVDDQEPRPGDLPELRVEPVFPFRAAQHHKQPGRGEEPDRYRAHVREPAQRDREMRLAGADGPVEHEIELTRHSGLLQFGKTHISTVYTTQVREHGMLPSTGTVGDSYGNAMAESADGAYRTELVWRRKPFRDSRDLESATFRWVSWRGLEASAPVLGPQNTGTDRNRVLREPSGASRPTIKTEQKSSHFNIPVPVP